MSGQFGAGNRIKCPVCSGEMSVIRKMPHPEHPEYERQTLECDNCQHSMTRTVDAAGKLLR